MKNLIFYLFLWALPLAAAGQNCASLYSYLKEGATLQYTNYDNRGSVESVMTQRVSRIEEKSDTLVATFDVSSVDAKGKSFAQNSMPVKCFEGVLYMDMRSLIPPQKENAQAQDISVEMQGNDLVFPAGMQVGQTLPDCTVELITRMGGVPVMTIKYTLRNRKVEAREKITTPAGTFDCLKITCEFEYKLLGTRTMQSEYWFAPEAGMVRSVNRDKRGKEMSKMELTQFKI